MAALASYLDARSQHGTWLLRIEDVDPLREMPNASEQIIRALAAHGLHWDETILYQSQHTERYQHVADTLIVAGHAYYCPCSRKDLLAANGQHSPGCRSLSAPTSTSAAIRFALENQVHTWQDQIQGVCDYRLQASIDDFVIKRKEGFFSYQLAVVCDDIFQRINQVVRGSDLLDSTPMQLALYRTLGEAPPAYAHLPVIINRTGQKLSKQNHAPALDLTRPKDNLWRALNALNIRLNPLLYHGSLEEILQQAIDHWSIRQIQPIKSISEEEVL